MECPDAEMIDELGRRQISVVCYSADELAEEVRYFGGLAARRYRCKDYESTNTDTPATQRE